MATLLETTPTRKPANAFYAFLTDDHGILTRDDAGEYLFLG